MATVAAVAAATATVAGTALSASGALKGGKGGGSVPGMPTTPDWEKLFNRGTGNILDEERAMMEDALAQGNQLEPEMYRALGFEPVYDQATDNDIQAKSTQLNALLQQRDSGQERSTAIAGQIAALRKQKGLKPAQKHRQIKKLQRERKTLSKKTNPALLKQISVLQTEVSRAQTNGRKIVGFNKLDHPTDPTQSNGDMFRMAADLQNETLIRALKGEEPVDGTLKHSWDVQENQLRERLRRTLGEDYETSSAGQEALATFDREKSNAFAQFNQQLIGTFSGLTENRAIALSNLTGARLTQMMAPAHFKEQGALLLGQVAASNNDYERLQAEERGQISASNQQKFNNTLANNQSQAAAMNALGNNLNQLGQGIQSGASGLQKYLGNNNNPQGFTSSDVQYINPSAPGYAG